MVTKRQRPPSPPALWDRDAVRREFISTTPAYGYQLRDEAFSAQCQAEYPALRDTCYLDSSASPPTAASIVHAFAHSLTRNLYSNPHSHSPSSQKTSDEIGRVRTRILSDLFGLRTASAQAAWDVVFTSGATASLKLVGDAYKWKDLDEKATYRYLKESHTSLVGLRGIAAERGGVVESMSMDAVHGWLQEEAKEGVSSGVHDLFAYPAQCNATGSRLGLELAREVKRRKPDATVLLDAAAHLATSPLDLSSIPVEEAPDFIACSFYKLYGYPTGLGCLLVKLSSKARLSSRSYFGGGSVDAISVSAPFWAHHRGASTSSSSTPTSVHAALEDGTLPFLSIIALGHAMVNHDKLYKSLSHVGDHTLSLARLARQELSQLQHANGQRVVKMHSSFRSSYRTPHLEPGPVVSFTLLDVGGAPVGHALLDRLATVNGFQIRTEEFADLDNTQPLGIARISFGAMSTVDDVLDWVAFIHRYFVTSEAVLALTTEGSLREESPDEPVISLSNLMLYPIKSCGGQPVPPSQSWQITSTGLKYDREWMLVHPKSGQTLSQKKIPRMALIRPVVDLEGEFLRVAAEGMLDLILPLDRTPDDAGSDDEMSQATLCGDALVVRREAPEVDAWFEEFLGIPCRLHRVSPGGTSRHGHFEKAPYPVPILLSNESPFLLISQESVEQVNEWISADGDSDDSSLDSTSSTSSIHASCFRANFTLSSESLDAPSPAPFFEDRVSLLRIGSPSHGATFQVLARCRRCLMVCVDQETGIRTSEPFSCLARTRKSSRGRIEFGVHLLWREDLSGGGSASVRVGDRVVFSEDVL